MSKGTIRIIIFSLIFLAVAMFVFGFMAFKIVSQKEELNIQVTTLQESVAQQSSHNKLKRLSEDTVDEREQLQKYFLAKGSESNFLNLVESLAPQTGVSLKTNSVKEILDEAGEVSWIEPSFTFAGSRNRVQNFIKILETLPYVLRLNSANVTSTAGGQWEVKVTMQVRVLSYDK
jgi:hypothetical protein